MKQRFITYTIMQCPISTPYYRANYQADTFSIFNYVRVYEGGLATCVNDAATLDHITEYLNEHPTNFFGRPIDVSDIIVLEYNGHIKPYYINDGEYIAVDVSKYRVR